MNVKKELQSVTLMPHVPTQWDPTTVPVSMATVEMDSTVPVRYLATGKLFISTVAKVLLSCKMQVLYL